VKLALRFDLALVMLAILVTDTIADKSCCARQDDHNKNGGEFSHGV
jgi:hypothetical protein